MAIAHAVKDEWSERAIAELVGVSKSVVHRYLVKLRIYLTQPEDLAINLPVNVLKPERQCRKGHVHDGDEFYCVDCDETGIEDHPRLRKHPRTTPKPDPKVSTPKPGPQTRRQKRKAKARCA